jgi:predicted O-linked N-acetylglucosamine transferase (SPINDLY family)
MTKLKVDQTLRRAKTHERKGEIDLARQLYQTVLDMFPKNTRAKRALEKLPQEKPERSKTAHPSQADIDALLALYNARDHAKLIDRAIALTDRYPNSNILWNMLGAGYRREARFEDAAHAFQRAIAANPTAPDPYVNLGLTLIGLHKLQDAVSIYQALLRFEPDHPIAHNNMGIALRDLGRLEDSLSAFDRALSIKPDYAEAHNNKGLSLNLQGKTEAALEAYQRATTLNPNYPAAHYNIGNAFKKLGHLSQAVTAYKQALALKSDYSDVLNNMGTALTTLGHYDDAAEALSQAIEIEPENALFHNNLGNVWLEKRDLNRALQAYQDALKRRPDYAEAHNNLGITLHEQGKFKEAISVFKKAIALRANSPEAYSNMGNTFAKMGLLDEAISAYKHALVLNPDSVEAESAMLHQMQHACDWSAFDQMQSGSQHMGITTNAVSPFAMLSMEDHPVRQMQRSRNWSQTTFGPYMRPTLAKPGVPKDRLRIGYFSADFQDHPCLYLLMGVLRCHDKTRFEVHAFSYGHVKTGDLRQRAADAVDYFHDVARMTDAAIVSFAHSKDLDIAIDLMGHTRNSRLGLFQNQLAPIQVSFVGYPGTTGTPSIDYLVGDPTVIPKEHRQAYTERILFMPHTYLPNDNTLPISDKQTTRKDFDLPEDAFVFCCFNNNYKISPREFDIWMRIMSKVENSVLWMLQSNRFSKENLQKAAQARGIDPARLIVGAKLPHPEHMARHTHADLFIDTFNYNAHTTASEALWAGLPIVTKRGEQFAARVAASMLISVGLPELITTSEAEYEARILELATDRDQLQQIREKLAVNRLSHPLFDTERYTRDFENGLQQAYDLYANRTATRDIQCEEKLCP